MLMASNPIPEPKTILVVDDDPVIRELFRAVLRRADFQVDLAGNGLSACWSAAIIAY